MNSSATERDKGSLTALLWCSVSQREQCVAMDSQSVCVLDLDDNWMYGTRNNSNYMVLIAIGRSNYLIFFIIGYCNGVFYENLE